jgi:DNA-binding response OmpR family regulator
MHLPLHPPDQFAEGAFAGRRVLVVEDDFLISLTTTDLLESTGCVIVGPAARMSAALELARSESLDAAILDIDIAGEAVWPIAEELKRRHVPFLFLSAFSELNAIPALFSAAPHLEKPLEQDRILLALSVMWRH